MSTPISEILAQVIKNIDRTETVNLTPGQIISLLVKQIEGNQALLTYQGKFLLARLEAALVPGERIRCMVEGEQEGRVLLKVLPDNVQLPENESGRAIMALLKELDLPVTEKNQQIIRELVRQELPVTRENIQVVNQLAQKTGAAVADLDVLAFVYKQNIPATAMNFELIKAAFKERDFLSLPMENLRRQLSELIGQLPAASELRTLGEKTVALIEKMTLRQGESPGQTQGRLADLPRLLGMVTGHTAVLQTLLEKLPPALRQQFIEMILPALKDFPVGDAAAVPDKIAALKDTAVYKDAAAFRETAISKETVIQKDVDVAKDTVNVKDTATLKDAAGAKDTVTIKNVAVSDDGEISKERVISKEGVMLKDGIVLKESAVLKDDIVLKEGAILRNDAATGDGVSPKVAAAAGNVAASEDGAPTKEGTPEDNLPALLNKLQGLVKGESAQEKALQSIVSTVRERLETLETLQRPAGPSQEGFFLLQSTFQTREKNYPLEMLVKYRKEEKGKDIDFSRCHVYVTLTTEGLGTVQSAVQLSGRNLNCRFTAESEKARQTIEKWLPDLTEKLAQLDFNVTMLPSRIREKESPPALAPVADRTGFYQVDIKV